MPDNIRVLDCRVDELQANLNALTEHYAFASWDWYDRTVEVPCVLCGGSDPTCSGGSTSKIERRVSVVMIRMVAAPVQLPSGFDPRGNRRN